MRNVPRPSAWWIMRIATLAPLAALAALVACGSDTPAACCTVATAGGVRIVNAFTFPIDVRVDGNLVIPALSPATIDTASLPAGGHTLTLQPVGPGISVSSSLTLAAGAVNTIAAVRSTSGSLASAELDDTNSVVPPGATKVRVLHLAPNAGTLQVYRTQPDFPTPVQWQFPFNYQPDPTSISAPFVQSTVGTWEIRVWQTPADSSGWSTAPIKVVLPLQSGEKRTILILDKAGGGIRAEVL